jgi:hypothetical protein
MAMTAKQKEKFQSEWKKPGNVKKNEIITPSSVVRGVAKVAAKVANTKAGVKATKTVAKKVQSQAVKQNKKTVEKVARMQEKTKAEKIAKNSVKSIPAGSKPLTRKTSGKPNYIYKDKEMLAIKESLKNVKLKKQGKK